MSKMSTIMQYMQALMAKGFLPETFGMKSSMFNNAPAMFAGSRRKDGKHNTGKSRPKGVLTKPNAAKRATKPLYGGMPRQDLPNKRANNFRMDDVRDLEVMLRSKLKVTGRGLLYKGDLIAKHGDKVKDICMGILKDAGMDAFPAYLACEESYANARFRMSLFVKHNVPYMP